MKMKPILILCNLIFLLRVSSARTDFASRFRPRSPGIAPSDEAAAKVDLTLIGRDHRVDRQENQESRKFIVNNIETYALPESQGILIRSRFTGFIDKIYWSQDGLKNLQEAGALPRRRSKRGLDEFVDNGKLTAWARARAIQSTCFRYNFYVPGEKFHVLHVISCSHSLTKAPFLFLSYKCHEKG